MRNRVRPVDVGTQHLPAGGFTTYSTFNYETLRLFQQDAWLTGAVYLGTTVVACLLAGVLGLASGLLSWG